MSTAYRITLHEGRAVVVGKTQLVKGVGFRHWWFRVESTANGKTLLTSEVYSTRAKRDRTAYRFATEASLPTHEGKQ